ncbi:MAG: MFS transporter [Clostridiales bacterium]|nr:MFS transporter [Clostridiales bacterium]
MQKKSPKSLNNPFIALRHKNYRLYFYGMCVSLIGTWMQNIAQPWLAYKLTNSPLLLSLVGVMQFMPVLLFSLFAGVVIDRFSKKKILFITQIASLIITLMLAVLVWLDVVKYWHILIAATALGFVNTLDMPTRQAFVIELIEKEDLMNAIALNSTIFNIARVLGPGLAGLIMGYYGIASCFYINSISFAAVIVVLFYIKPIPIQIAQRVQKKVLEDIVDGLRYIKNDQTLLYTILVILIIGTFAMNYSVLVPVFAEVVLRQQETGYGFLMSFMGIGSLSGAIFIASMSKYGPKKSILHLYPYIIGILLILTGFTKSYFLTAFGLASTGFFFVAYGLTANSSLQSNLDNSYRGRVMSVYTLVFSGSTPIGNFFAGLVTDHLGSPIGFISCGIMIFILVALLYLWDRKKRPS